MLIIFDAKTARLRKGYLVKEKGNNKSKRISFAQENSLFFLEVRDGIQNVINFILRRDLKLVYTIFKLKNALFPHNRMFLMFIINFSKVLHEVKIRLINCK